MDKSTHRKTILLLCITAWTVMYVLISVLAGQNILLAAVYFFMLGMMAYAFDKGTWLSTAVFIMCFVSGDINILFTGTSYAYPSGQINLHILTYYVLGAFMLVILDALRHRRKMVDDRIKSQVRLFAIILTLEIAIEALKIRGVGFSNYAIDVFFGPIVFYVTSVHVLQQTSRQRLIATVFGTLVSIAAVYGIIEYVIEYNMILGPFLVSQKLAWYDSMQQSVLLDEPYRITSLMGHPLTNAAFYLGAYVLALTSFFGRGEKKNLNMLIAGAALVGVILTFSRFALFLAALATLWLYVKSIRSTSVTGAFKWVFIGLLFLIAMLPVVEQIAQRDSSGSSTMIRLVTLTGLIENGLAVIPMFGYGPQNMDDAVALLTGFYMNSNLEIGYVIILLQYGVVFTALYLWGTLSPLITFFKSVDVETKNACYPYALSFIAVGLFFAGSNTIGVRSTINYVFFFLLSLLSSRLITKEPALRKGIAG